MSQFSKDPNELRGAEMTPRQTISTPNSGGLWGMFLGGGAGQPRSVEKPTPSPSSQYLDLRHLFPPDGVKVLNAEPLREAQSSNPARFETPLNAEE